MSSSPRESQRTPTDESLSRLRSPLPAPERTPSRTWQNWAYFGASMMALSGLFWMLLGFIALVDEEFFTFRTNQLLAIEGYAAWGWAHLVGGALAVFAGVNLLWGARRWARILGIVVAAASAVINLGFMAAAPVWSTLVIALDILVIFALTVHGWEIEER